MKGAREDDFPAETNMWTASIWIVCFPVAGTDSPAAASLSTDRIVHVFDFDERPKGNLEDMPKFWEPIRAPGFPRYAGGEMDESVGRLGPPSFHITSSGRNAACLYSGPETPVVPHTEYRVEGYVRAHHLQHARACLSAMFLDHEGRPLLETLVRSRFIGGGRESEDWVRVEMFLSAAPPGAASVGLIAWVLQETTWNTASAFHRPITAVDVEAGAWFDDITVYRLPRVAIAAAAPGNVMAADERKSLHVTLADAEGLPLTAQLEVNDAAGRTVLEKSLASEDWDADQPLEIRLDSLEAGFFHARLAVGADEAVVLTRELSFLILPAELRPGPEGLARSFGLVIDPRERADRDTELALLRLQSARSVKLPIWTGLDEDPPDIQQRRADEKFLGELIRNRFSPTGVLWGPPAGIVRRNSPYHRPLVDLLAGDPSGWEAELAAEVAPAAGLIHWWQMGADGDSVLAEAGKLESAVSHMRTALETYLTAPRLAAAVRESDDLASAGPAVEQLCLAVPAGVDAAALAERIKTLRSNGFESVTAYVPPLSADAYERIPRLGEWSRRLIQTRHAGADVVFAPPLWTVRRTPAGPIAEPTEEYLVLRTIGEMLGGSSPGPSISFSEGVQGISFRRGASAVLALWDDDAPIQGTLVGLQLGGATRQVDLWGRSTSLTRDTTGLQQVRVSPVPVFVDDVEAWLLDMAAAFSLEPSHVESNVEMVRQTLQIDYQGSDPMSGEGVLIAPRGIEVSPRRFSFAAAGRRTLRIPLDVRYGHNEPAGRKEFTARITLHDPAYSLEIPMVVELGLSDVEVSATAVVERGDLVVRHVIRNRSPAMLHFRSTATAPGRERQHRPVAHLGPGQTQTVAYHFSRGTEFIGRNVHLSLRELNDGPRRHNLKLVVP